MSLIKKTIALIEPIEEEFHTNQIVILNNLDSGKKKISFNVESILIDASGAVDLKRKSNHPSVNRNLEDVFSDSVTFTNESNQEVSLTGATVTLALEEFFIKYYNEDLSIRESE